MLPSDLRIDSTQHTGQTTLSLTGRLTAESSIHLRKAVRIALQDMQSGELVIDLTRLDYIDSLSIGLLIRMNLDTQQKGVRLVVANAQPPVMNVFKMVHLERVMTLR